jgi:DNA-binding CsgD family transcriptional regulator
MSRTFAVLRHRFQAVLAALDRFHVGVMVLSPSLNVVVKNEEARRILDLDDGLCLDAADRPKATDTTAHCALQRALRDAVRTVAADPAVSEAKLTLPRRSGATNLLVEVCPFVDQGSEFEHAFRGAYLLVVDPEDTSYVRTDGMQTLYALTDAEADVCGLLAEGHSTEDMADLRGVRLDTLRKQIKTLLHKTRTRNRAQLVRRALLVNLPIDRP